jgi:hypothetical protein
MMMPRFGGGVRDQVSKADSKSERERERESEEVLEGLRED